MSPSKNGSDYQVERFGPYEVHQRLGLGGMATVHLAMERGVEGFERWVALKRLLPHLGEDDEFVRSFVREAQLASCLSHPNVVKINQLGKVGDDYFISMEYIEGRDVRALLRQARKVAGPPPLTVTASLLLELLDALDYAHRKTDENGRPLGLVHRDISPSNLLVNVNGHLKIIDFGIAKATSQKSRTQTGKIKGKLAYISPEVLRGKAPDARSDLFSVGIIAHEMLTARPLFASKNDYKTIQRIQNAEVLPPSSLNTNCPGELDDWVLRALTKERDDRWSSAREMLDALGKIIHDFHLHATSRDVASWVEWSFSLPLPERGVKERKRAARVPPRAPTLGEGEEELLDLIWGSHGGPRAPLNLDEIAAQIANSPDLDIETDPASVAPTALLFAVGPNAGHAEHSDESWNKAITIAAAESLGAEIESEFESTEPNGLVGPSDSAAFGTIDLSGEDLEGEDWLTDAPPIDRDSALFSESELTALGEPLGGGPEARTAPASPRPLAKADVPDVSPDKGDFDDTEPQDVAPLGAVSLPPPVLKRPPGFVVDVPTTDSQATTVRPALDARRVKTRKVPTDELPTRRDKPKVAPESAEFTKVEAPKPEMDAPFSIEEPAPAKTPAKTLTPSPSPAATKSASPTETKPVTPLPATKGKSKKTTLRGLANAKPDPAQVVLLKPKKTKKRITARTSVPPLPEPEEPTVTVTGASMRPPEPEPEQTAEPSAAESSPPPPSSGSGAKPARLAKTMLAPPRDQTPPPSRPAPSSAPPPRSSPPDSAPHRPGPSSSPPPMDSSPAFQPPAGAPPMDSSPAFQPPAAGAPLESAPNIALGPLRAASPTSHPGFDDDLPELPRSPLVPVLIVLAVLSLVGSVAAYFLTRGESETTTNAAALEASDASALEVPDAAAPVASRADAAAIGVATPDAAPDSSNTPTTDGTGPTRRSGQPLRIAGSPLDSVRAKICIDRRGRVQSVRVLGDVAAAVAADVSRGVSTWVYEPYRRDHKPVKACFESTLPIER